MTPEQQQQAHMLIAFNKAISGFAVKIAAFMHAGGQEVSIEPKWDCNIPLETKFLRSSLIREEVAELLTAIDNNDFVDIADGIADVLYVVIGTALAYGIPTGLVFDIVSENNMTKINAETGVCDKDEYGKILKPEGYVKVALQEPLEKWAVGIKNMGGDEMFKRLVVEGYIRQFRNAQSLILTPGSEEEAKSIAILSTN
jgi:predicted HAD superfamily Cof-like phosphohydrolase